MAARATAREKVAADPLLGLMGGDFVASTPVSEAADAAVEQETGTQTRAEPVRVSAPAEPPLPVDPQEQRPATNGGGGVPFDPNAPLPLPTQTSSASGSAAVSGAPSYAAIAAENPTYTSSSLPSRRPSRGPGRPTVSESHKAATSVPPPTRDATSASDHYEYSAGGLPVGEAPQTPFNSDDPLAPALASGALPSRGPGARPAARSVVSSYSGLDAPAMQRRADRAPARGPAPAPRPAGAHHSSIEYDEPGATRASSSSLPSRGPGARSGTGRRSQTNNNLDSSRSRAEEAYVVPALPASPPRGAVATAVENGVLAGAPDRARGPGTEESSYEEQPLRPPSLPSRGPSRSVSSSTAPAVSEPQSQLSPPQTTPHQEYPRDTQALSQQPSQHAPQYRPAAEREDPVVVEDLDPNRTAMPSRGPQRGDQAHAQQQRQQPSYTPVTYGATASGNGGGRDEPDEAALQSEIDALLAGSPPLTGAAGAGPTPASLYPESAVVAEPTNLLPTASAPMLAPATKSAPSSSSSSTSTTVGPSAETSMSSSLSTPATTSSSAPSGTALSAPTPMAGNGNGVAHAVGANNSGVGNHSTVVDGPAPPNQRRRPQLAPGAHPLGPDQLAELLRGVRREGSELSLAFRPIQMLPHQLARFEAPFITNLNLTECDLISFQFLDLFSNLQTLILDKNDIDATMLQELPHMPSVTTLWLNNNRIDDLPTAIDAIMKSCPNLHYLSMMRNPACPGLMDIIQPDLDACRLYRLYVLFRIPHLRVLDCTDVTQAELREATLRGEFAVKRRPTAPPPSAAGAGAADHDDSGGIGSFFSSSSPPAPAPKMEIKYGDTDGSASAAAARNQAFLGFTERSSDGKHSEGNRFIRDTHL